MAIMWLWAASASVGFSQANVESAALASLARLDSGYAVLIDARGRFLCQQNLVRTDTVVANFQGDTIELRWTGSDPISQLALMETATPLQNAKPITLATSRSVKDQKVFAVIDSDLRPGQVVSADRMGIMKPSQRYLPLSEILFESPSQKYGGSFVFTAEGKLFGVLSASLEPVAAEDQTFGPRGLTVSYSISPDLLNRVVSGFRSESKLVKHPTVGLLFKDARAGGCEVVGFMAGSTAKQAGIRVGDRVTRVGQARIRSSVDLAKALFQAPVGSLIELTLGSGDQARKIRVTVGATSSVIR